MQYFHLHVDQDGESHWRDVDVPLQEREFAPPAKSIEVSDAAPASQTFFLRLRAGWNEPTHPTPVAQWLICRQGQVRVTASDGDSRVIGPGDVWMMEDTHGKGHHTQVISEDDFECVMVQAG
jgi:hypothetical protein